MNTSRKKTCGEIAEVCLAVIARSTLVRRSPPSGEGGCDEAIHTCFCGAMDCFAALAMTGLSEVAKSCTINSPPSTRPCAWRGGVGSGGSIAETAASEYAAPPPTPDPSPPLRGGRGAATDAVVAPYAQTSLNPPTRRRTRRPCAISPSRPRSICRSRPASSASARRRWSRTVRPPSDPQALHSPPC